MNILLEKLNGFVQNLKNEGKTEEIIKNAVKEQLQYVILDFIYNNPAYSYLVMYGGTLLRIGYDLPRMSEDLDFQTDKKFDFENFKNDLITHFKTAYSADIEITTKTERLTGTDVATIKFPFFGTLKTGHRWKTLKIKLDVNYFHQASDFATETIPITKDTYAFSIKTYTISTLMASKVDAVLSRKKRGIGHGMADHEPRDIYDLMWYMGKKIIPNLDYLRGKGIETSNILELFNQLALRVLKVDDHFFEQRLASLHSNRYEYDEWHRHWKERFQILRNNYQIYRVGELQAIHVKVDFLSDDHSLYYFFSVEEAPRQEVQFICLLRKYWYVFTDLQIASGHRRKDIESKVIHPEKLKDLDYEYLGFFYTKIEDYLKRNNRIVTQPIIRTKLIRDTGENLNIKTQVMLDRRLLEKIKFEDLI